MLVYDIIKNCDIAQAIRIYLDDWADEDELIDRDKTIAKIYNFWKMICRDRKLHTASAIKEQDNTAGVYFKTTGE